MFNHFASPPEYGLFGPINMRSAWSRVAGPSGSRARPGPPGSWGQLGLPEVGRRGRQEQRPDHPRYESAEAEQRILPAFEVLFHQLNGLWVSRLT